MYYAPHILQIKVTTPFEMEFLVQVVKVGRTYASVVVMITLLKSLSLSMEKYTVLTIT